jgi:CO/xanthine dehydrogenase FAD-binding subunit
MSVDVVRPETVRHATALLAGDSAARFVGGGTLVVRAVNGGDAGIRTLVLSDGLGLDGSTVAEGRAELGAAVTMAEIAAHPALAFLWPVAGSIGGPAVRAMATVGGNLFARPPYGDFSAALLALGAELTLEGPGGEEALDLGVFLADRDGALPRIVHSILFDIPPAGSFRFVKAVRRRPHGAAVLSIAAVLPLIDGIVSGARIAYCAMAPTPIRAGAVERALEEKPLDRDTIALAVAVAAEGCAPADDAIASAWYRLSVLPAHLGRLLAAAAEEAGA